MLAIAVVGTGLCVAAGMHEAGAANPKYAGFVIDANNGKVLYQDRADEYRYPASLTKMMTLYLLFQALESGRITRDTPIPVSANAASKPASKLYLKAGSTIPVDTAIRALFHAAAEVIQRGQSHKQALHLVQQQMRCVGGNDPTLSPLE